MHLLDLPNEILMLLPQYLRNIVDLNDAASSCRKLHTVFTATSCKTILSLAAASSREYFRPHPHFLVAATVRQVSDWARLSPSNTITLRKSLEGGIESLLELCLSKAGVTLDDIRRLHAMRYSTLNPLIDMLDRCAGVQWNSTPNFWNGGVSDAFTVFCEPQRALFQLVIYGELFSSAFNEVLNPVGPVASPPCFDLETRLDYWRYCVPNHDYWNGTLEVSEPIYVSWTGALDISEGEQEKEDSRGDLEALRHVLYCRTWREAWEAVRREIGPDFEEGWRQELWVNGVQLQGLQGLEMLRPGGLEKWRGTLGVMRKKIEELDVKYRPKRHDHVALYRGRLPASDAPIMAKETLRTLRERVF